jgi:VWFA-related protein
MRQFAAACLVTIAVVLLAPALRLFAQQQELPRFTSSVDVTSLDVSVFDGDGQPVSDLTPDDFLVKVDGAPRRVVSAEWIQLRTPARRPAMVVPEGYSSNEDASGGRLILIVVDQPNIRFGGTLGIRRAVNGFLDRLQLSDRAAVIGLGRGAPATSFTADRERLKRTIDRLVGQHVPHGMQLHNLGVAEALEIARGNPTTLGALVARECLDQTGRPLQGMEQEMCSSEIEQEARDLASSGFADGRDTIAALRGLIGALKRIDGPKTLVFISEGFLVGDLRQEVVALGTMAAAARTSIYALKLDGSFLELMAAESRNALSRMDDRAARAEGLEILTDASRGSLFNVIGTGAGIFSRIESELAGYYLVGVESAPADRNGRPHPIAVEVRRKGLTVRSRRMIASSTEEPAVPAGPDEAVTAALAAPLPVAALPIRVATYSLQGPEAGRVQLLIHADVGTDYSSARQVSLGYVITDMEGRPVDRHSSTARLPPVMNGVPSSLQFSAGASLPPGEYAMKLAVAEGDRVGTVEHTIRAGVIDVGDLRVSDLMIGGPAAMNNELLQPTIGYHVVFGAVHGYLEAYGRSIAEVTAKYDIAAEPEGTSLLGADVTPRVVGGGNRAIFTQVLPVRQLPPGKYYLRVSLFSAGVPLRKAVGAFEVSSPAVLMTSASIAPAAAPSEVYLPVNDAMLSRRFDAASAIRPTTVQAFRNRVPAAQQSQFDRGVKALLAGSYGEAETSFKNAISVDADSSSAIAFMAATFAAAGHDAQAASAWQTALVDGSDLPEIYEWLGDALMRSRDLALARSVLEEAIGKWPADVRFARPIALIYASFGQGPQAVRSLERHLSAHPDDVDGLLMGVEWIYQLRLAGATAHSPDEDLKLARRYADLYNMSPAPQSALVKQWIEFLEQQPR